MRKIDLSSSEFLMLSSGLKHHPKAHVRNRFQALLLSNEGWKIKDIAKLLKVRTRTIYTWMDNWNKDGVCGLFISTGRGRKPLLNINNVELVELVKKKHYNLLEVLRDCVAN